MAAGQLIYLGGLLVQYTIISFVRVPCVVALYARPAAVLAVN